MNSKFSLLILLCGFAFSKSYGQTTVNLNPTKDNSIFSENTGNSAGQGRLFSGKICNGPNRRALIQFDLSGIPSDAEITSVSLTLTVDKVAPGSTPDVYTLHRITTEWGEGNSTPTGSGGIGAAAQAPDATWNDAQLGTVAWTTPGGDFVTSETATHTFSSSPGNQTFVSTQDLVDEVQNWLNGVNPNFGWMLKGDEGSTCTARRMGSSEAGTAPRLSITYNADCSPSSGTDTQTACNSFDWIDGNTYTESNNTATHLLTNAAGCDSLVSLNLSIINVDASTSNDDVTITANASGASYQWIDCDNSNALLDGETNQSFTPDSSGNYAVVVTENGCMATSECVNLSIVGFSENFNSKEISIYPNPGNGKVNLDFKDIKNASVQVFNTLGKPIFLKENITKANFQFELNEAPGLYFIKIENNEKQYYFQLVKK